MHLQHCWHISDANAAITVEEMLFDIMAMIFTNLEMHFTEVAQELFYCHLFAPHHPPLFHYQLEATHLALLYFASTVYSCSLLPHMTAFFNSAWSNLH